MKKQNWLLIGAVTLLTALPLWLAPKPAPGPDGQTGEAFAGSDSKAEAAISEIAPAYQRWFEPILEPAGGEIESLLFALQAAIGAGIIGYWLGVSVTREKFRRDAARPDGDRDAEGDRNPRAD